MAAEPTADELPLTVLPHDFLRPLLQGEVKGFTPVFRRQPIINGFVGDGFPAGEVSLNRYILMRAKGDDRYLGLPAFVLSGFRHRCFFVPDDSPLRDLAQLAGARVGVESWAETGHLWARAALREAGVELGQVEWVLAQPDPAAPRKPSTPYDPPPPPGMRHVEATLAQALRDGEVDAALTSGGPPASTGARRLVPDLAAAERAYYQRTGILPALHILVLRRDYADRRPELARLFYDAVVESWNLWRSHTGYYGGPMPWTLPEMERAEREMPDFFPPFGASSEGRKRVLAAMCKEQCEQGLIAAPVDPGSLFDEFSLLAGSG